MTAGRTFEPIAPPPAPGTETLPPPQRETADEDAQSAHWSRLHEAGLSAGLWFVYFCHRLFGRAFFRGLMVPVSWYYLLTRPVARRASLEYLQCVGELDATTSTGCRLRAVARHIQSFADVLLDKALVWTGAIDLRSVRREVDPRFDAAVARREGGVLVVAHLGNLELLRALAAGSADPHCPRDLKLHILVHTRHAQRFNRLLRRLNPRVDDGLLQVTGVDAGAAVNLAADVEQGHLVVIAADRVPVTSERVLCVPFFGRLAPLPVGPWVLASALRCPVYWLTCCKDRSDRYTLVCEQLSARVELPRATRTAALAAIMTRYAQRLEQSCRRAPYAWFNFYPFWGPSLHGPAAAFAPVRGAVATTRTDSAGTAAESATGGSNVGAGTRAASDP